MTTLRRIELICGVLAGIAGMVGVGIFFYAPLGMSCASIATSPGTTSGASTCGPVSYVAANGASSAVPYWVVFGAFCVIVVLGAVQHSLSQRNVWRGVLWTGAALLLASSIFGAFSIGLFLLPGALLALVAAVLADVSARRRARANTNTAPAATAG